MTARWGAVANLSLVVEKGDRVLQVVVAPGWLSIALERDRETFEHPERAQDGVGPHKHKLLGMFESPADAILTAEKFAAAWLEQGTFEDTVLCTCGAS